MNKLAINQYLTEQVFKDCWHGFYTDEVSTYCIKCNRSKLVLEHMHELNRYDFFTNEGCMQLWLEIQKKDWFLVFLEKTRGRRQYEFIQVGIIHPELLAPAVENFLKGRV